MSTNPSTRTRAVYGASVVDNLDASNTKPIRSRRDSAAPLIHTPPIQLGVGEDPLDVGNTRPSSRHSAIGVSGSYARHHGGQSRMALRRRRNSESSSSSSEEEEPVDANVELNTSDEEQSDYESEEDSEGQSSDDDDHTIHNHLLSTSNDIRISGLNEAPKDTSDQQTLFLEEEDVQIHILGYKYNKVNLLLYRIGSVLTLGILWLVFRWVPRWYISWVGIKVPLRKAEWLVFRVSVFSLFLSLPFIYS